MLVSHRILAAYQKYDLRCAVMLSLRRTMSLTFRQSGCNSTKYLPYGTALRYCFRASKSSYNRQVISRHLSAVLDSMGNIIPGNGPFSTNLEGGLDCRLRALDIKGGGMETSLLIDLLDQLNREYSSGLSTVSLNLSLQKISVSFARNGASDVKIENLLACLDRLQNYSDKSCPESLQVLSALLKKMDIDKSLDAVNGDEICRGFYHLRHKSADSPEIRGIIDLLTSLLQPRISSAELTCLAIEGLQNCRSQHVEVRDAIACFSYKLHECLGDVSRKSLPVGALCGALHGLKLMKSDVEEVCVMLKVLSAPIYQSMQAPTAAELSKSFNGLQSMNSSSEEVMATLSVLLSKVDSAHKNNFSPSQIAMSIYGLKSMRTKREVKMALVKFTNVVRDIRSHRGSSAFSLDDVEQMSYGLKNMNNDCLEVRRLVSEVAIILKDHVAWSCIKDGGTATSVSNILYGMNCMNKSSAEVASILSSMRSLVELSDIKYSARDLSRLLYGLRSMHGGQEEVILLLETVRKRAFPLELDSTSSNRFVVNTIYPLRNLIQTSGTEGEMLFKNLCGLLNISSEGGDGWDMRLFSKVLYCMSTFSDRTDGLTSLVGSLLPDQCLSQSGEESPTLSFDSIGNALFGLQGFSDSTPEIRRVLARLTSELDTTAEIDPHISGHSLLNMLRGISNKSCEYEESKNLLRALARPAFWERSDALKGSDLSDCFYSLRTVNSNVEDAYHILAVLNTECTKISPDFVWDTSEVFKSIRGLQNMNLLSPVARDSLSFLSIVLQRTEQGSIKPISIASLLLVMKSVEDMGGCASINPSLSRLMQAIYSSVNYHGITYAPKELSLSEAALLLRNVGPARKDNSNYKLLSSIANSLIAPSARHQCGEAIADIIGMAPNLSKYNGNIRVLNKIFSILTQCVNDCNYENSVPHLISAVNTLIVLNSRSVASMGLLDSLLTRLKSENISADNICKIPRNFQFVSGDSPAMRRVLKTVVKVSQSLDLTTATPAMLCSAVGGLRDMTNDDPLVQAMLRLLSGAIRENIHGDSFSTHDIAIAMEGVQTMRSGNLDAVHDVISSLADKLYAHVDDNCSSGDVTRCLSALKHFGSRPVSVRRFLSSISPRIRTCSGEFSVKDICCALGGMGNMSDEHVEVRTALAALTGCIESLKDPRPAYILKSLHSFRSMHSGSVEVKNVVKALTDKLSQTDFKATSRDVCSAIFGIQGLSSSQPNLEATHSSLSAVTDSLVQCKRIFTMSNIGAALYGLSHMHRNGIHGTDVAVSYLIEKMRICKGAITPGDIRHILFALRTAWDGENLNPQFINMMSAFNQRLDESTTCLVDSKTIGVCTKFLNGVDCERVDVLSFVSHLSALIKNNSVLLENNGVLRATVCLSRMQSGNVEVLQLVSALTEKLSSATGNYTVDDVVQSFSSLNGISTDGPIEDKFVLALAEKTLPHLPAINMSVSLPHVIANAVDQLRHENVNSEGSRNGEV